MAQYLDKDGLDNLLSMINNNFVKFGDLDIPKPKVILYTEVEGWSYEDFESFAIDFMGTAVYYMSELATVSPVTLVLNEDEMYEFHSICKVNETSMVKVVISATADEEGNYTVTQNLVEIPLEGGSNNVPTKTSELTNDSGFITANDNVASATKLQTMRYINGSPFDGTSNVVSYAVCTTGASTTAKTVSISRFSLATGSQVRVKFSNANTASAPTLNVGSTGAKRMSYKGSLITNANFSFSTAKIYTFTYDGTYWVLEGDWDEVPSVEPMICAYTIGSYTARTIALENHTYNGQTMNYREGAIISVLNPNSTDIVFAGGTVTLDGNQYEADAFTLKSGATALFSLGPDPGVLLPISSVVESNSGGSSEGGSSAYEEVNHGTSDTTFELTPNTFHIWDEVTVLNLTLGDETSGVANEYLFQFTSSSTPTTLTLPDDIKFSEDLVIEANKIYQISILKGLGSVLSWDNAPIIYFTISTTESQVFQAEQGMTWLEWVNSEYNTDGYKSDYTGRVIGKPGTYYIYNVTINDTIMPNNNYTVASLGPSGGGAD